MTLKFAVLADTDIFHAVIPSRRGLLPAVRPFLDSLSKAIDREGLAQVTGAIAARPVALVCVWWCGARWIEQ